MTPAERTAYDLFRIGHSTEDIAIMLSSTYRNVYILIQKAVQKHITAVRFETTKERTGFSSLRTAHGYARMEGTR